MNREIAFTTPHGRLDGSLDIPANPRGLIVIALLHPGAHTAMLAPALAEGGFGTFSFALLTAQELHFPDSPHNVPLLTERLLQALEFLDRDADTTGLPVGLYAEAAVTPAAIRAAARRDKLVKAIVCHRGIVDLAGLQYLELLVAPLLMVLDEDDPAGEIAFHRGAAHLGGISQPALIKAGENPANSAVAWFARYL